jgi:predicted ATPase
MLVGAYRDNEVSSSHPLMRTLRRSAKPEREVEEIVLAPLGLDDVGRLVADALHCEPGFRAPLAQLVHEKTGGNPFFAIQFLTALAEEGLLRRDPDAGAWIWDLARIRAQGYTDNVVDLMVEEAKAIVRHGADRPTATRLSRKRGRDCHSESGFRGIRRERSTLRSWKPSAPG